MRISDRRRRWSRAAALAGPGVAVAAAVALIAAAEGDELGAAIDRCPPWILAAATASHLATLVLRSEAWSLTLHAVADGGVGRRRVHAANAGAFVAGTIQSHAAMPARIGLLTSLCRPHGPSVPQVLLADAPIFLLEVVLLAVLSLAAAPALGIAWWAPLLTVAVAAVALGVLGRVRERFAHRRLTGGLAVLCDRPRRRALVAVVTALTAIALFRVWLILLGFGLPHDPALVVLVLVSLGAIGLLPLGLGTGPVATVAALGGAGAAEAAAAGLAVSATTVAAVLIYAAATWAPLAATGRASRGGESAEPAPVLAFPPRRAGATTGAGEAGAGLDLAA